MYFKSKSKRGKREEKIELNGSHNIFDNPTYAISPKKISHSHQHNNVT